MDNRKPIVLIVEDEDHIANLLVINLRLEGFTPIHAGSGKKAIDLVKNQKIDLVVLDVMLPDSSGIDICRKIKHLRKNIPILMLSALGQSSDKIKGLKSGADDYLAKPFNLEELILRMNKLVSRYDNGVKPKNERVIEIGSAIVDFDNFVIKNESKSYRLTSKEIELLSYMYEHRNEVLSRQEILENVWGFEIYPNTRTIDNFISSFRKYTNDDVSIPQHFITIRGVGYKLSL